jgi:tetratricopeptide (TPR) repeat protein
LAALLVLSIGFASAQLRPADIPEPDSPSQQFVSVNQLLTPAKAQRATERARREFIQGRLDSALRETERALEIYPRCAAALSIQGAVNLSRTNYAEASRRFQQAIDAEPAFGPAYLGLGMAYTSQGRFKEALIPLDRAASFLPSSWIVYFESAVAHLGLGEPEAALKDISYAARFTGTDPQKRAGISYLRGMANFEMKDYREAQGEFNEAVERDVNGLFAALAKSKLEQLASADDKLQVARSSVYNPF